MSKFACADEDEKNDLVTFARSIQKSKTKDAAELLFKVIVQRWPVLLSWANWWQTDKVLCMLLQTNKQIQFQEQEIQVTSNAISESLNAKLQNQAKPAVLKFFEVFKLDKAAYLAICAAIDGIESRERDISLVARKKRKEQEKSRRAQKYVNDGRAPDTRAALIKTNSKHQATESQSVDSCSESSDTEEEEEKEYTPDSDDELINDHEIEKEDDFSELIVSDNSSKRKQPSSPSCEMPAAKRVCVQQTVPEVIQLPSKTPVRTRKNRKLKKPVSE